MAIHGVERRIGVRQGLAVGDAQVVGGHAVELEVLACKIDRGLRQVDAGDARAALGEPHQIGADAAAHFEHLLPAERRKVDQLRQVMELVEAVVIEIIEKRFRADRVVGHFEIVNTVVPVVGYRVDHSVALVCAF